MSNCLDICSVEVPSITMYIRIDNSQLIGMYSRDMKVCMVVGIGIDTFQYTMCMQSLNNTLNQNILNEHFVDHF